MKTLDEFRTFYEEEFDDAISDALQEIKLTPRDAFKGETEEPSLLSRVQVSLIVGGVAFLMVAPSGAIGSATLFALVCVVLVQVIGGSARTSMLQAAKIQKIIKKNVAAKIVSFFGTTFR